MVLALLAIWVVFSITTHGGMLIFQGSLLGVTGGVTVSPAKPYLYVGQAYVPVMVGWVIAAALAAIFVFMAVRATGLDRWRSLGFGVLVLGFTGVMASY